MIRCKREIRTEKPSCQICWLIDLLIWPGSDRLYTEVRGRRVCSSGPHPTVHGHWSVNLRAQPTVPPHNHNGWLSSESGDTRAPARCEFWRVHRPWPIPRLGLFAFDAIWFAMLMYALSLTLCQSAIRAQAIALSSSCWTFVGREQTTAGRALTVASISTWPLHAAVIVFYVLLTIAWVRHIKLFVQFYFLPLPYFPMTSRGCVRTDSWDIFRHVAIFCACQ